MENDKNNAKTKLENKKLAPSNSQQKCSGERLFNIKTSIDRLTGLIFYFS